VVVRRGIGRERQRGLARRRAEMIEHHPRLHPRRPRALVDLEDVGQVLADVDHDGLVARLTREARPSSARDDRHAGVGAQADRHDHVVDGPGDDHPKREMAVIGRVGRVHGAIAAAEANLTLDRALERGRQIAEGRGRAVRSAIGQAEHRSRHRAERRIDRMRARLAPASTDAAERQRAKTSVTYRVPLRITTPIPIHFQEPRMIRRCTLEARNAWWIE
jgi:hypothetical protein